MQIKLISLSLSHRLLNDSFRWGLNYILFQGIINKLHINILSYPFPISAKKILSRVTHLQLIDKEQFQNSDTQIARTWLALFWKQSKPQKIKKSLVHVKEIKKVKEHCEVIWCLSSLLHRTNCNILSILVCSVT